MTVHDEVLELLPWFVNGSLNEHEQARVNDHLRECRICGGEVQQLMRAANLFSATPIVMADSTARARDRFMQELAARERRAASSRRWIVPASLAACLVLASLFLAPLVQRGAGYQTLSAPDELAGPVVQIVFRPDTTEADIRALVLDEHGDIVSGPTAHRVYRVRLAGGSDPSAVVARLRENPAVSFAELESKR